MLVFLQIRFTLLLLLFGEESFRGVAFRVFSSSFFVALLFTLLFFSLPLFRCLAIYFLPLSLLITRMGVRTSSSSSSSSSSYFAAAFCCVIQHKKSEEEGETAELGGREGRGFPLLLSLGDGA